MTEQIDSEKERKSKLLEFAYAQVLDATKHQDDKIGRLLTAIAFITASSLALASMGTRQNVFPILQSFKFGDETPHSFALYALVIFLLGVIATVVLLITSMATPLRFPGVSSYKHSNPSTMEDIDQVNKKIRDTSPFYFAGISSLSPTEWEQKWELRSSPSRDEIDQVFIDETHNLSARVNIKYSRTSEAVSIFSFSLLAYAISIFFVFLGIARGTSSTEASQVNLPISLDIWARFMLGAILSLYTFLQIYSNYRYENRLVGENNINQKKSEIELWAKLRFASFVLPIFLLSNFIGNSICRIILIFGLAVCFVVYSLSNYYTYVYTSDRDGSEAEKVDYLSSRPDSITMKNLVGFQILAFSLSVILLICQNSYTLQIFYCLVLIALYAANTGLTPTKNFLKNRRSFEERQRVRNIP